MSGEPPHPGQDGLEIDAILERVRAELAQTNPAAAAAPGRTRQRSNIFVMLLEEGYGADIKSEGWTLDDFEALDEETFLHTAYRVLLGRSVDHSGLIHFLPALRDGRSSMVGILGSLRFSAEGKAKGVHIPGLRLAWLLDLAARAPVIGHVVGPFLRMATRSRTIRRLQRRIAASDRRRGELVSAVNETLKALRRSLMKLEAQVLETQTSAQSAVTRFESAGSEFAASRQLVAQETRQLARLIDKASASLVPAEEKDVLRQLDEHALDSLYLAFENRFRGSPAEIGARQKRYLGMFQSLEPVAAGKVVLDIGCGRGEWLELLGSHNIPARGIDLNSAMVEQARARRLDVVEQDAIAYLRAQPEASLGAITGFHIVEHLAFRDLVALFDEAWRVLVPGGAILFETPNPENLVVGACTFNYDPTHNRPLPPDFLRFLAEARGYGDVRIIRTEGDCVLDEAESGFAPSEIHDWFNQPPDYAVFARKKDWVAETAEAR